MNVIHVTRHLERREEAQDNYRVGSVKHLRLELDLESLCHFGTVPGNIIVVVLRPVCQAIKTVVQGVLEVCVDRLNDG